jgi:hypothetical protein
MTKKKAAAKEKVMLTVREVADRIDAGTSSVRKWAARGLFPGAEFVTNSIVPYWVIPEDSLSDFVKPTQGRKPALEKQSDAAKNSQNN